MPLLLLMQSSSLTPPTAGFAMPFALWFGAFAGLRTDTFQAAWAARSNQILGLGVA